jgi:hypothetical protein
MVWCKDPSAIIPRFFSYCKGILDKEEKEIHLNSLNINTNLSNEI